MRLDLSIPPVRPVAHLVIARRVLACDPVCVVRPYFLHYLHNCCDTRGPIPFSSYLKRHNRQDRDDLSRTALPLFVDAPGAPLGKRLDVLA